MATSEESCTNSFSCVSRPLTALEHFNSNERIILVCVFCPVGTAHSLIEVVSGPDPPLTERILFVHSPRLPRSPFVERRYTNTPGLFAAGRRVLARMRRKFFRVGRQGHMGFFG